MLRKELGGSLKAKEAHLTEMTNKQTNNNLKKKGEERRNYHSPNKKEMSPATKEM